MKLIVCVDDNYGILFNKRRQSMDAVQRNDVKKIVENSKVYMSEYTFDIYENMGMNLEIIDENTDPQQEGYFIYEDSFLDKFYPNIEEIICYFWNRNYPYDTIFDEVKDWKEIETFDFIGNSHEKITRKRYVKEV